MGHLLLLPPLLNGQQGRDTAPRWHPPHACIFKGAITALSSWDCQELPWQENDGRSLPTIMFHHHFRCDQEAEAEAGLGRQRLAPVSMAGLAGTQKRVPKRILLLAAIHSFICMWRGEGSPAQPCEVPYWQASSSSSHCDR